MFAQPRYYRVALFAQPRYGYASFSWRMKEALEACGHTVFFFSPHTHHFLFNFDGDVLVDKVTRFLEVQGLDCLLFADGLDYEASRQFSFSAAAVGIVCEGLQGADEYLHSNLIDHHFDFAFATCDEVCKTLELAGIRYVKFVPPLVDYSYAHTPIANEIAGTLGVLCVQNATEERLAFCSEIASTHTKEGQPCAVRCLGEGWIEEWNVSSAASGLIYALRSSGVVVLFGGSDDGDMGVEDYSVDALISLALQDGCDVFVVGERAPLSYYHENMRVFPHAEDALEAISVVANSRGLVSNRNPVEGQMWLNDALALALNEARECFVEKHLMLGSHQSRKIVCVLGYFGMGNFGDEYILSTLDERLRTRCEGASIIAISEHPHHTLLERGIYAIALKEKRSLDNVLAYASVALVVAGLLFDQGIRWTMGKAEVFSNTEYPDIPGIADYAILASMNGAQTIFYGIGAGPLEIPDARCLVKLIGKTGALFVVRDAGTEELLLSCGLAQTQLHLTADTAFLGRSRPTNEVDAWLAQSNIDMCVHKLLVLSLREYENLPQDFSHRIALALDAVARRFVDVRFVLCILDPNDISLAESVLRDMNAKDHAFIFDQGNCIETVADLLTRAYAGLSMRYHCSLLLNRAGKPCVGLDYLPKVFSLYKDTKCMDLLLPVDATPQSIEAKLCDVLASHAMWSEVVRKGVDALHTKSQEAENILIGCIAECSKEKESFVRRDFYLRDTSESENRLERALSESHLLEQTLALLRAENERLALETADIRHSRSFKIGSALMRFPSWCKRIFQRMRLP